MTTRSHLSHAELFLGIQKGDSSALARGITLMESSQEADKQKAYALLDLCLPVKKRCTRLGITGVPGVGKSTFIEALGELVTREGKKVAVLAIDPSSTLSKGSILGDKTRMPELAKNPQAFIRPSPAGQNLGGVARNTREAMMLCEAAGFDLILIETVGVGQSEIAVHSMVDFFLLLQLAGAGDELQGIKRGIMEMADALVINKADGDNFQRAEEARSSYQRALALYPPKKNGWVTQVLSCSSLEKTGIQEVWELIKGYMSRYWDNEYLQAHRSEQNAYWFKQSLESLIKEEFYSNLAVRKEFDRLMDQVVLERISPFQAAHLLLQTYKQELK